MSEEYHRRLRATLLSLCAIVIGLHVYWGDIDIDEEFYVTIIRLVAEGKEPYTDFFYTQTPLLPYIYACVLKPFGGVTLLSGRLLSGFLAFGTVFLCMRISRTLGGRTAAAVCGWICLNGVVLLYNLTLIKTYSLAAFLLVLGLWILLLPLALQYRSALSLVVCSAAAGVRLSLAPVVPLIVIYLLTENRGRWKELSRGCALGQQFSV